MAWVEKLPSGRWRGGWRDPNGRKHYTTRATHPGHPWARKSDARAAAVDAEARAQREAAADRGTLSARTTWRQWWQTIAPSRTRIDTNTDSVEARIVTRYLLPHWGDTPLNAIKRKAVQAWVDDLTAGQATGWERPGRPEPSYVRRIYSTFASSIRAAVDRDVLTASPCARIRLPPVPRKPKPYLTSEQAEVVGTTLRADYRDAVLVLAETGLRPSELCGLHAHDVDLDRRVIEVRLVHVDRKRVIRPRTKTGHGRIVPLTATAADIIKRRLDGRDLTTGCGVPHTDDATCTSVLVFRNHGRALRSQHLDDAMRRAGRRGAPVRTPYAARRGFVTRLADAGVDAFQVARVAGHSVKVAQGYAQQTPDALRRVLAALGDAQPLAAVPGAAGAQTGADPSQQAPQSAEIQAAADAV